MDPESAIGTASAVLSFVEFTYKFVSTVSQIYDSGDALDIATLENVTLQMKTLSLDQRKKNASTPQTPDQAANVSLAEQCQTLSQKISDQVKKVKPKFDANTAKRRQKLFGAVKSAIKTFWNDYERMRLLKKLENCRQQFHLNLMITQK